MFRLYSWFAWGLEWGVGGGFLEFIFLGKWDEVGKGVDGCGVEVGRLFCENMWGFFWKFLGLSREYFVDVGCLV